ncbi:MAG: hypothetical protein AB2689_00565 [Candidatus Thiodiazotropha taylori]
MKRGGSLFMSPSAPSSESPSLPSLAALSVPSCASFGAIRADLQSCQLIFESLLTLKYPIHIFLSIPLHLTYIHSSEHGASRCAIGFEH